LNILVKIIGLIPARKTNVLNFIIKPSWVKNGEEYEDKHPKQQSNKQNSFKSYAKGSNYS